MAKEQKFQIGDTVLTDVLMTDYGLVGEICGITTDYGEEPEYLYSINNPDADGEVFTEDELIHYAHTKPSEIGLYPMRISEIEAQTFDSAVNKHRQILIVQVSKATNRISITMPTISGGHLAADFTHDETSYNWHKPFLCLQEDFQLVTKLFKMFDEYEAGRYKQAIDALPDGTFINMTYYITDTDKILAVVSVTQRFEDWRDILDENYEYTRDCYSFSKKQTNQVKAALSDAESFLQTALGYLAR